MDEQATQVLTSKIAEQDNSKKTVGELKASQILDGGDSYVDLLGTEYLLAFISRTDPSTPTAYNFCTVFEELFDDEIEGFPANPKAPSKEGSEPPPSYPKEKLPQRGKVNAVDWASIKTFLEEKRDELSQNIDDLHPPAVLTQLESLGEYFKLSPQEEKILKLLYVIEYSDPLRMVMQQLTDTDEKVGPTIARMFDDEKNYAAYAKAVSDKGKLATYNIIVHLSSETRFPVISHEMEDVLNAPDLKGDEVKKAMVGVPTETNLTRADFAYLEPELGDLIDLVREAAAKGEKGINILLDGPTGGGKTELAKVIIQEAGLTGFSIGEDHAPGKQITSTASSDGFGDTESITETDLRQEGEKRFAALLRADKLLEDDPNAVMHFDEFEDLLIKSTDATKPADTHSKVGINTFMLHNKKPIIHCGNNPEKFDPSLRNRFIFSLFVDYPPIEVRAKIWRKQLALQNYELPEKDIIKLARKYDASPRQITHAIRFARITGNGVESIARNIPASARITTGSKLNALDYSAPSALYSPSYSNLSAKEESTPSALIERAKKGIPFSLFAKGPAGSGLQALTRHLAEGMVKNPNEETMASLSQPTQQQTPEQRIGEAFASAANQGRFLIIHDIEELAFNPESRSSWINEDLPKFFTQVARDHNLPFAVTTTKPELVANFPGYLLNSFSDHISLSTMSADQKRNAFSAFFKCDLPDASKIKELPDLVVGDFAAVQKYLKRIDPAQHEEDKIIDLLKRQSKDRAEMNNTTSFLHIHDRLTANHP